MNTVKKGVAKFGDLISKTYHVGTVKEIPVKLTTPWIFIAILIAYQFTTDSIWEQITYTTKTIADFSITAGGLTTIEQLVFGGSLVIGIYSSVLLHEFGHAVRAQANGLSVDEIRLWVLGGVANINLSSTTAKQEFDIAIGGPIVSAVLAVTIGGIGYLSLITGMPVLMATWLIILSGINALMLAFNLLPVFPLDGGRILRSGLQYRYGNVSATRLVKRVAMIGSLGFAIFGIKSGSVFYIFLSGLVVLISRSEMKTAVENERGKQKEETIKECGEKLHNGDSVLIVNNTNTPIPGHNEIDTTNPIRISVNNRTVTFTENVNVKKDTPDIVLVNNTKTWIENTEPTDSNTLPVTYGETILTSIKTTFNTNNTKVNKKTYATPATRRPQPTTPRNNTELHNK
jgi:Zn-dependent protease